LAQWYRTAKKDPDEKDDAPKEKPPKIEGKDIDKLLDESSGGTEEKNPPEFLKERETDRHPEEVEGISRAIDKLRAAIRTTDRSMYLKLHSVFGRLEKDLFQLAEALKESPHPRPSGQVEAALQQNVRDVLGRITSNVGVLRQALAEYPDVAGEVTHVVDAVGLSDNATDDVIPKQDGVSGKFNNRMLVHLKSLWPDGSQAEDLAAVLGVSKENAIQALSTFEQKGMILYVPDGRYCLSPRGYTMMQRFNVIARMCIQAESNRRTSAVGSLKSRTFKRT